MSNVPIITRLTAREILDCRGLPTVQVDLELDESFQGRADVPAGRSRGSHEAVELRDGGTRFGGFGVRTAVGHVKTELARALVGQPLVSQRDLDRRLTEVDGSPDKSRLGANSLLGVSLAAARAAAARAQAPLYRYLNPTANRLPVPQFNLINGGRHAANDLDFQEFIVIPIGAHSMAEALQIGTETNLALFEILASRYGKVALNTGDEGGFAPPISDPDVALGLLHLAVENAGHDTSCVYGLDCAATHWYSAEDDVYRLAGDEYSTEQLIDKYLQLIRDFNVVSIEDPFQEDAFEAFASITEGSGVQIVGDDLFTTNVDRLKTGISQGSANALLWKVNQIGTLTEAVDAAQVAFRNQYEVVVSERSGETEDPLIADLAVAIGAGQIKTGAPVRGERTAKYNRLLQIEEDLGLCGEYVSGSLGTRDVRRAG